MKHALLLSVLGIGLLSSCSTAFKAGQTPDDIYYSPGRVAEAKQDVSQQQSDADYQQYIGSMDDRYLRMRVANRYRWDALDNNGYWYDSRYDFSYNYYNTGINPYSSYYPGWGVGLGYGLGYGSFGYGGLAYNYGYGNYYPGLGYSGYYGWNNPICGIPFYTIPHYGASAGYTAGSNLSAYHNKSISNTNYGYKDARGNFVPSNNNSSFSNLVRKVFTGNDNSNSYDRAARTFTPQNNTSVPSTSSSAGGSSGGFKSTGSSTSSGRGGRG